MRSIIRSYLPTAPRLRSVIFLTIAVLFIIGLFFLFYAYIAETARNPSVSVFRGLAVQILAFFLGFCALFLVSRLKYQFYRRHILLISGFSVVAMLLLATPLSIERNGAVRWVDFSLFQFQPSEILKLAIVLFFAVLLTNESVRNNWKKLLMYGGGAFGIFFIASVLQPDYGTFAIVTAAVAGMALVAGLPKKWWFRAAAAAAVLSVLLLFLAPSYLADRFEVFYDINFGELSPEERYGTAYHALQNLEAVRVGGIIGRGPGYVAQSSHLSIPEVTTDSIFALVAAETGFLGSALVIILFLFFFLLCYAAADLTRDPFGRYAITGITTLFAVQFFVNVLAVLGFPATGIPLIFFSRGGTSLFMTLVSVGIILNILGQQSVRRELDRSPFV